MLKKIITIVLSLCLIFSISVMTVIAVNETAPGTQQGAGERPSGGRGGMPPMGEMPSGDFTPPEGFTPPQNTGETIPPKRSGNNAETVAPKTDEGVSEENPQTPENSEDKGQAQGENWPFGGQMPEGMGGFPGNIQNSQNTVAEQPAGFLGFVKTYPTPITSVVLLGLAFIFVVFYRRKNY